MAEVSLGIAFIAGALSFFSPCVVPLIPGYLAFISGISLNELQNAPRGLQTRVFTNAVMFTLGFSVVFILLGMLIAGAFGQIGPERSIWLNRIGGAVIIAFGLNALGLLKLPFLERGIHPSTRGFKPGYLKSASLGAAFGLGWTPCFGPILASILILAGTSGSIYLGGYLLAAYSIGLAVPFIITGLLTDRAFSFITSHQRAFRYFNIVAGLLLIGLGIIVFTNRFAVLLSLTYEVFGFAV